jgi:hypothetical protein
MGLAKFENSADPIENFQGLEKLKPPLANSRGKGGRPIAARTLPSVPFPMITGPGTLPHIHTSFQHRQQGAPAG